MPNKKKTTTTTTTVTVGKKGRRARRAQKKTVRVITAPNKVKKLRSHEHKFGKSKRALGKAVHTSSPADHYFTEIQSQADTRPFDASFQSEYLTAQAEGSILFSQTLSAVSLALMQQEANKDANGVIDSQQTLVSGILNFMDYRLTELSVRLIDASAGGVSGKLGVMFLPHDVKVTKDNFSSLLLARAGNKAYPGTRIISMQELREEKSIVVHGQFLKGGRPVGLSSPDKLGVIGKIVIGVLEPILVTPLSDQPGTSQDAQGAAQYNGKICQLAFHCAGEWIFLAPGQVPSADAIAALEVSLPLLATAERVDPPGVGDWVSAYCTGVTPANVARLMANDIALGQLRNAPPPASTAVQLDTPMGITFLEDTGGSAGAYFGSSTFKFIGDAVVEGVASFAPPGISQLIVWGGRTMVGVIDRIINTQSGMLAKEQTMQVNNNIVKEVGNYRGTPDNGLGLTPSQTGFVPNAQPFGNVPLSQAVQALLNHVSQAEPGSVNKNIFWMVAHAMAQGIYPFAWTSFVPLGGTTLARTIRMQDIVELFIQNKGGVSTLLETVLVPQVGQDDTFAGIPFFRHSNRETAVQPGYVRYSPTATSTYLNNDAYSGPIQMRIYVPPTERKLKNAPGDPAVIIDFHPQASIPSEGWFEGSFMGTINEMLGDSATPVEVADYCESFFGHSVSVCGTRVTINHTVGYAARAAWDGFAWSAQTIPIPTPANDSGCGVFSITLDTSAAPYDYVNLLSWKHYELLATEATGKHFRSISSNVSDWTAGTGALYWIEPDRCQSV